MAVDLALAGRLIADMARTLAFGYVARALMRGGGACDAPVDVPGRLCAECWSKVRSLGIFIDGGCGLRVYASPFEIEAETPFPREILRRAGRL